MYVLDLSVAPEEQEDFYPGTQHPLIPYSLTRFPGGEEHICIDDTNVDGAYPVLIICRTASSSALIQLMLAVDALRELDLDQLYLFLPYVPYARQDRVGVEGEAHSLRAFSRFINSMGFVKVFTFDNHSDVSTALIERCYNVPSATVIKYEVEPILFSRENELFHIVSPDAGALKKIYGVIEVLNHPVQSPVIGMKHRDMKTGEISHTSIISESPLLGYPALVVDDICDGGRTFIELAKVLKTKDVGLLYLYVTHGIFSNDAIPKLLEHYDRVITTDSLNQTVNLSKLTPEQRDRVIVVPLQLPDL